MREGREEGRVGSKKEVKKKNIMKEKIGPDNEKERKQISKRENR